MKKISIATVTTILIGLTGCGDPYRVQQHTPEQIAKQQRFFNEQMRQLNEQMRQMEGDRQRLEQWSEDILQRHQERVDHYRRLNWPDVPVN